MLSGQLNFKVFGALVVAALVCPLSAGFAETVKIGPVLYVQHFSQRDLL